MVLKNIFLISVFLTASLLAHKSDSKKDGGHGDDGHGSQSDEPSQDADAQHVLQQLDGVNIEEKIGQAVMRETVFTNQNGEIVSVGDYLGERPVLLSFLYLTCPSLCQYVVNAKVEMMKKMGLTLGSDYSALSISFDDRDTAEAAMEHYDRYARSLKRTVDKENPSWDFLVGNSRSINRITTELGFQFKWLEDTQEFAHTAAIYILSPSGKISRYFYGLEFSPFDVKMAVLEAKDEKYRSTLERVLLYCYRYDNTARGYVADAWKLMRVGGGVTALGIAFFLFMMFRYERKRGLSVNTDN